MDVFDTHTHLNGNELAASSFWDIVHYAWFAQELRAAGYPEVDQARRLEERDRIEAFLEAFQATRNTAWNWALRHLFV